MYSDIGSKLRMKAGSKNISLLNGNDISDLFASVYFSSHSSGLFESAW